MELALKHPSTGETRFVKIGWSWTMFFFSTFFGIIWFMRGLKDIGFAVLGVYLVSLVLMAIPSDEAKAASIILMLTSIGFIIWAALKGNEVTAKRWLRDGYAFADPASEAVRYAKLKWRIA